MTTKLKKNDFKVGLKAMLLFEQMTGQDLTSVMTSEKGKTLGQMVEIMACAYKNNDIESYAEFKEHPDFDDIIYMEDLTKEIFEKIMDDMSKKKAKYRKK